MIKKPPFRKLRGYAFDPSLSLKIDTVNINDIVYKIAWEEVEPGPSGEYIEVVDFDPTVKAFYQPVDLNNSYLLAQDGLDPSESNPQFHQQMAYAVTMLTIKNFEKALGRKIIWSPRRVSDPKIFEKYVQKLRVYPHAMREANAYYSPLKKSLLFGYFSATSADETLNMPASLVFTCLSHDIVAHETTHAILDGMHNAYNEPTNPDMLAFHEAFADIVALFQHFTFPEVLKHQVAKTKGDLGSQNLLGQLAQEFGTAIGSYGSLRDAIGEINPDTKQWQPKVPDPGDYRSEMEPHARGSILVAAVFEAFISIYKSRVGDLIRIASDGTGILRQGEIHPDLVNRLAMEASKAADHVLRMCIRALDYCPPVDLNFGDYLRAIITADVDLVADDNRDYRLAFIDAFRKRGIYPEGIRTLSVDSLKFPALNIGYTKNKKEATMESSMVADNVISENTKELLAIVNDFLRDYAEAIKYKNNREEIYNITRQYISGDYTNKDHIILGLHKRINNKFFDNKDFAKITGLAFVKDFEILGVGSGQKGKGPVFQIQNLRLVSRVGPDDTQINQVVFSIIQRSGIIYKEEKFSKCFQPPIEGAHWPEGGFIFKGGCTLIFDLDSLELKYAVSRSLLDMDALEKKDEIHLDMQRLNKQYAFQNGNGYTGLNEFTLYFGNGNHSMTEPFAFLHQH